MIIKKIIINSILILFVSGVGHLYAMEIIIQGEANETYDQVDSSQAGTEHDWITNIILGITARSEIRALDFDLSGNIYQRLSATDPDNNSNSQDLVFSLNKDFSENVTLEIEDNFQNYPEPSNFSALFGRSDDNDGYLANSLMVNLAVYVTAKLFFDVSYNYAIMNNDSDQMSDSILHNPEGNIGYNINSSNIVRLGYAYQLMKYNNDEKIRGDRGYAEFEKHFTEQLSSVLQGGYDYLSSNQGESLSTRWMVSILDDVDENNHLNISYTKESTISNITNDVFKNWTIAGSLVREISERFSFNLSLFYGMGSYQYSGVEEKLCGVSTGISYVINDFINCVFSYSYTWNKSVFPASENITYNRNIFSAGLSAVY